jgi:hypothetical protein
MQLKVGNNNGGRMTVRVTVRCVGSVDREITGGYLLINKNQNDTVGQWYIRE